VFKVQAMIKLRVQFGKLKIDLSVTAAFVAMLLMILL
jgi:hypothetical protein